MLMLRTMQKARYAPENLGHFGLASPSYTHFTSPIRRYPDLVVHRALRAARARPADGRGRARSGGEELPEIARHTSEMERRADDAERELLQWKKVKFMADKVGDEFEGYVTGVAAFGLFIELIEHFVEGMVHVSTMADDYYRFLEGAHLLAGENTHKVYRLGDKVKVQVIRVNMEVRQVDLGLVEILERVREGERGPRRSKAAPKFEKQRKQRPGRNERRQRKGWTQTVITKITKTRRHEGNVATETQRHRGALERDSAGAAKRRHDRSRSIREPVRRPQVRVRPDPAVHVGLRRRPSRRSIPRRVVTSALSCLGLRPCVSVSSVPLWP